MPQGAQDELVPHLLSALAAESGTKEANRWSAPSSWGGTDFTTSAPCKHTSPQGWAPAASC